MENKSEKISKTLNIEALKEDAKLLYDFLSDPHPDLLTWRTAIQIRIDRIAEWEKLWASFYSSKGSKEPGVTHKGPEMLKMRGFGSHCWSR